MKIIQLETFLTNAGSRNYLFVRLKTDTGLTGLGEASLEWQEKIVQTLIHEWVEDRVVGVDPFDREKVIGQMIRDQYQGGSTIMTAISGVEVALWDIIGKACDQPVYPYKENSFPSLWDTQWVQGFAQDQREKQG